MNEKLLWFAVGAAVGAALMHHYCAKLPSAAAASSSSGIPADLALPTTSTTPGYQAPSYF